jgi:predicted DNA-binding protein
MKRVAFELKPELHGKLKELSQRNSQGYSEYIRGLIAEEYNRVFNKKEDNVSSVTDTEIVEILKKIEINTRRGAE